MSGVPRGVRMMRWVAAAAIASLVAGFGVASASSGRQPSAHPAAACANPEDSNPRDPANPLDLPSAPGVDPLYGAHFFVAGPAHGTVAKAIEQLIGDHTSYQDTDTWASFRQNLLTGPLSQAAARRGLTNTVRELIKIGDQEETNNLSEFAEGGGPGAIFAQTQKINCVSMLADPPGRTPTIPVFSTFFIYPHGLFCPSYGQLYDWVIRPEDGVRGHPSTFKRMINEMAAAQGSRRAVYLLEIDAVGASLCMHGRTLKLWEYGLRYEIEKMTALPHVVAYEEAGSSDEDTARYVAKVLHDICVIRNSQHKPVNVCTLLRGFWTNGTHFNWSSDEIQWGSKVAHMLDKLIYHSTGEHYHAYQVINTAQNGRGPLRPRNRHKYGNELLCNPPGRGLGRQPTASTMPTFDGHTLEGNWYQQIIDAFLWSGVPGRSHSSSCPNGPWKPAGVFDPRFALELAENANQQLGPGFPSQPY